MGLVFAAGSMLIILLGVPALWYFVGGAVVIGAGVALALRLLHRRNPS